MALESRNIHNQVSSRLVGSYNFCFTSAILIVKLRASARERGLIVTVECQNKYRSLFLLFKTSPPDGSHIQDQVTRSISFSRQMEEQSERRRRRFIWIDSVDCVIIRLEITSAVFIQLLLRVFYMGDHWSKMFDRSHCKLFVGFLKFKYTFLLHVIITSHGWMLVNEVERTVK